MFLKYIKKKKHLFLFLGILLLALSLRLLFLFFFNSFMFDEMVSVKVAEKSLGQIWDYLHWEMHPPLHFYFLHFWMKIFGAGEIVIRLSSLFLSLLSVIAIYFLSKEIFDSKKTGLFASFLFSISPFLSFYSVWSRMYIMLFLFSTLSFYFFLKITKEETQKNKTKKIYFILYLLSTIAALYSHITALLVPFIQFIYIFIIFYSKKLKSKNVLINFLSFFVLCFVFYLPWFFHFVLIRIKTLNLSAWYFHDSPNPLLFFYNPLRFLISESSLVTNNIGLFLIIVLFLLAIVKIKKDKADIKLEFNKLENLLLPILIFVISFISLAFLGLYVLRYFIIPCLGFLLILSHGLAENNLNKKIKICLTVALVLIIIPSFFSVPGTLSVHRAEEAASFIEVNEKSGDKIITAFYWGLFPLEHYYNGSLEANAVIDDDKIEKDMLLTAIKTNYYSTVNEGNVNKLSDIVPTNGRIFFVFTGSDYGNINLEKDWFLKNNWEKTGEFANDRYHNRVWILEKK